MKRSIKCPQCLHLVVEVKKNTTLNNLIEKYLEKHPDRKRPYTEIEALEKLNTTTNNVVKVLNSRKQQPVQKKQELSMNFFWIDLNALQGDRNFY